MITAIVPDYSNLLGREQIEKLYFYALLLFKKTDNETPESLFTIFGNEEEKLCRRFLLHKNKKYTIEDSINFFRNTEKLIVGNEEQILHMRALESFGILEALETIVWYQAHGVDIDCKEIGIESYFEFDASDELSKALLDEELDEKYLTLPN